VWFVKSKRAQTNLDYETWIEGGVSPTLSGFDSGDSRAVTLVVDEPICVTGERTHALTSEGADASEDGTGRGTPIVTGYTQVAFGEYREGSSTLKASDAGRPEQSPVVFHATQTPISGEVAPRLGASAQLGTETVGGVRRITPVECERLQGFPDDWTDPVSDSQRYRQMGNAVTVNVAEWVAWRLIEADEGTPE
jgi:DNA (cytosine-5)-methyltransferase 1